MLEPVFAFFEKLVTEFSWRRLGFLFGVLVLVTIGTWIYESYTGNFRLARVQKSIQLLRELAELSDNRAVQEDQDLTAIYQGLQRDLEQYVNKPPRSAALTPGVRKGLAAAAPWVVIGLFYIPGLFRGKTENYNTLLGIIVIAVPFTILGVLLPTYEQVWINDWVYPWGAFVLFVGFALILQKRKKQTA